MDATLAAGIMGLVGAVIGGYGSYLGGIRGSKQTATLLREHEEEMACQRLGKLLDFICHNLKKVAETPGVNLLSGIDTVLYDNEWPKHLGLVNNLTNGERDNVITLLTGIQRLSNKAQRGEQVYSNDVPVAFLNSQNQELILNIANKLLKN